MVTLSTLLGEIVALLSQHGIDDARFEAELIIEHITGADWLRLLTSPSDAVSDAAVKAAMSMAKRRINGEPLQYLLGEWEFYGFPFKVGDGVLIPRQDTETLVEIAQKRVSKDMLCADLCAGSGCIGIALSRLSGCAVHSYELSDKAFGYLNENIILNGVENKIRPINADVLDNSVVESAPMYDIIVSNPPYLTAQDMKELQTEVTYEPEMALFGGDDGLDFYRMMLRIWSTKLKQGGLFAVEIGIGQENDVMRIFEENGIKAAAQKDYCGIYRVVYGIK